MCYFTTCIRIESNEINIGLYYLKKAELRINNLRLNIQPTGYHFINLI